MAGIGRYNMPYAELKSPAEYGSALLLANRGRAGGQTRRLYLQALYLPALPARTSKLSK